MLGKITRKSLEALISKYTPAKQRGRPPGKANSKTYNKVTNSKKMRHVSKGYIGSKVVNVSKGELEETVRWYNELMQRKIEASNQQTRDEDGEEHTDLFVAFLNWPDVSIKLDELSMNEPLMKDPELQRLVGTTKLYNTEPKFLHGNPLYFAKLKLPFHIYETRYDDKKFKTNKYSSKPMVRFTWMGHHYDLPELMEAMLIDIGVPQLMATYIRKLRRIWEEWTILPIPSEPERGNDNILNYAIPSSLRMIQVCCLHHLTF